MNKFFITVLGIFLCNLANAATQTFSIYCQSLPNQYLSNTNVEQSSQQYGATATITLDDKAFARLSCSDVQEGLEKRGTATCAGVYLNDGPPSATVDTVVTLVLSKKDGNITGSFNASNGFGNGKITVSCTEN